MRNVAGLVRVNLISYSIFSTAFSCLTVNLIFCICFTGLIKASIFAEMFLRNFVVLMLSLSADLQLGSLDETLRFCKRK